MIIIVLQAGSSTHSSPMRHAPKRKPPPVKAKPVIKNMSHDKNRPIKRVDDQRESVDGEYVWPNETREIVELRNADLTPSRIINETNKYLTLYRSDD